METRKFIWNFFLVLLFGAVAIIAQSKIEGFWTIAGWLFFCILTGMAASRVESTFKAKPDGK